MNIYDDGEELGNRRIEACIFMLRDARLMGFR